MRAVMIHYTRAVRICKKEGLDYFRLGPETLLSTGAKIVVKGGQFWLYGYSYDDSDLTPYFHRGKIKDVRAKAVKVQSAI